MERYRVPTLTIAGSDSSGGAGIQADLKTFCAIGTYGMSVITAITAQNTQGVFLVEEMGEEIIKKQIEAVFDDIPPEAVKIGMVSSPRIIDTVVDSLNKYSPKFIIVDPVMISKSGYSLLKPDAEHCLIKRLIPTAYILTPNNMEAEVIVGRKIKGPEDMISAGKEILKLGPQYVLMKGGYSDNYAIDILIGKNIYEVFKSEKLDKKNTHGTGCTLSSAITAYLALGFDIVRSVSNAKEYVTNAIRHSFDIGHGTGPVHHFYNFQ